jgi:hypothetical protein
MPPHRLPIAALDRTRRRGGLREGGALFGPTIRSRVAHEALQGNGASENIFGAEVCLDLQDPHRAGDGGVSTPKQPPQVRSLIGGMGPISASAMKTIHYRGVVGMNRDIAADEAQHLKNRAELCTIHRGVPFSEAAASTPYDLTARARHRERPPSPEDTATPTPHGTVSVDVSIQTPRMPMITKVK